MVFRLGLLLVAASACLFSTVRAAPGQHHFLWRVTDAPAPFYLLGSMHALRGADYPLAPEIDRVIQGAKNVYLEADIEPDIPQTSNRMWDAIHYPTGTTLRQKVKPETYARLKRLLNTRESNYFDVRPWAIAYFMLGTPGTKNFSARLSLDGYIYYMARGHAHISGLETVDELLQAAIKLSDAENESFLLQSIAYRNRSPRLLNETIDAWKAGDTQQMYRLYVPRNNEPGGYWSWVEKRNLVWVPRIEAAMKSGQPTLVVVGALHFCGPNSVITLLQKRGHKIEQQ